MLSTALKRLMGSVIKYDHLGEINIEVEMVKIALNDHSG